MQRAAVHMPVPFYVRYARKAVLRASGTRQAPTEAERRPAVLARAAAIKNTDPSVFCPLKNEHTCL